MNNGHKQYFIQLLNKYRLGKATQEEIKFLETYYDTFELNEDLINDENEESYQYLKENIRSAVDQQINRYQKKTTDTGVKAMWIKYAAVACLLIFSSIAAYLFISKNTNGQHNQSNAYKGIVPGSNQAELTLANGMKIILNDVVKGEIAKQSGVRITKTASGQIVYEAVADQHLADQQLSGETLQNTFSTPRGGRYTIILPDGTKVWLNAASSLTYPVVFSAHERLVTLNGEAYFEVSKNKEKPFRVKSGIQTIEVLGTHFNVNAYADESMIKTTLLEGSVKVSSASASGVIVPGEQAVVNKLENGSLTKHRVNLDKETAWKNGLFSFENDDLKSIMRQVCRWYNIDAVYVGKIPDEKYFGEISRNSNLAEVFKILELNNVKFDVDGKVVRVSYSAK